MTAPHPPAVRYCFAGFELNPTSGELRHGDSVRRLEPQPTRVLVELLRRQGEVVPRVELQRTVWGDSHVERDQGLNYCVRQIRAALSDEAAEPRYLETLPRRGYRFLVPATSELADESPAAGEVPEPVPWWRLTHRAALGLVLATTAVLIGGGMVWRATAPHEPLRLALRPFVVAEASPTATVELRSGADRLGERLLAALVGVEGLELVGPATTAGYAVGDPELATALAVDHVVSGAVRPPTDGEPGTVFAQLTRGVDGGHLFGRRFAYRNLDDAGEVEALCADILEELLAPLVRDLPRHDVIVPAALCRR